jgi:hypothetical protein
VTGTDTGISRDGERALVYSCGLPSLPPFDIHDASLGFHFVLPLCRFWVAFNVGRGLNSFDVEIMQLREWAVPHNCV